MSDNEKPLSLLSLGRYQPCNSRKIPIDQLKDGGGVKGITTLLILREVFKAVKKHVGKDVQPWEIFDLIGGTSTGGCE